MTLKTLKTNKLSDFTSIVEGPELGEMCRIWKETATSEMRMKMMSELRGRKLGFNEIENFSLGLQFNFKSGKMKDQGDKPLEKVIESAMNIKMIDEKHLHNELKHKREIKKKRLGEQYHPKTKTYKQIIKFLRSEARNAKEEHEAKYKRKIEHLEHKYRDREDEDMAPPKSMEHLAHLSVFNNEKYAKIEPNKIDVPRIGEVTLTEEEESILRRSPKFSIMPPLMEDKMKEDMEKAYSLIRMELRDEGEEEEEFDIKDNDGKTLKPGEEQSKEEMAKGRQVYDPITEIYDEGKRRVTDLAECTRVTLPKPISVEREAQIETRR